MDDNSFKKPPVENVIPLKQAVEWTTSWRNWLASKGVKPEYMLKGFMIPIADIINLSKFPVDNLSGVRAYLSLSDPDDVSSVKIVLVPVDKDKRDILAYPKDDDKDKDEDSAIFDLTMPCPHFCDEESPLT